MRKIDPVNKKIVVKQIEESRSGSIFIPENASTKRGFGTIVSISPDCSLKLQVGDVIVYPLFDGFTVSIDREDFVILDESKVLGKIIEEN